MGRDGETWFHQEPHLGCSKPITETDNIKQSLFLEEQKSVPTAGTPALENYTKR